MRELYVVPLPKTRYKAWDYYLSAFSPYFETLTEVCEYLNISKHYNLIDQIDHEFNPHRYRYENRFRFNNLLDYRFDKPLDLRRYVFFNDWGSIVAPTEVVAAAPFRRYRHRKHDQRLYVNFTRTNPNKFKKQFRQFREICYRWGRGQYEIITTPELSCFRHIHTASERRVNIGHVNEYGANIVRGRRRKLPSNWDDISISAWYDINSWKRNSKRRKQWKIKETV